MEADIFRLLQGGAKFDKQRFQKDVQRFEPTSVTSSAQSLHEQNVSLLGASKKSISSRVKVKGSDVPSSIESFQDLIDKYGFRVSLCLFTRFYFSFTL